MRRALLVIVASALTAGCTGGAPPARHHHPGASPAATFAIPDYTDTLRPRVLRGPSKPRCPRNTNGPVNRPARPWDVNGDDRGDLLLQHFGEEGITDFDIVHVLLTSAQGKADCDEPVVFHLYRHSTVTSGDFNGDGYADVAASYELADGHGLNVIPGGPSGLAVSRDVELRDQRFDPSRFAFGTSLATADFNRDGFADLAVSVPRRSIRSTRTGSILVMWGGRHGLRNRHTYRFATPFHTFSTALATGDIDGDGYPDLVESAHRRLAVMSGGPRGPRHPKVVGPGYGFLVVGDVTGDDIADVAASHPGGRGHLLLYLGGSRGLSPPIVVAPGIHGLPGRRHRGDQFHAVGILPGSNGHPGTLVATANRKAAAPELASTQMWLIPGSTSGVRSPLARIVTQASPGVPGRRRPGSFFGWDTVVRNVVGDGRPELVMSVNRAGGPLHGYMMLQVFAHTMRGRFYVRLPRRLNAEHLPLVLR